MFIGRERELEVLDRLYRAGKFEFTVIYGRYRVGKTAFIDRFIRDKKAIYFMGVESDAKQDLEDLSKNIMESETGIQAETAFISFQAALEYVFKLAEKDCLVLVIDEYPYVARSSKSLASTLQLLIDKYKDHSKIDADPMWVVDVLYGRSCTGVQSTALWQTDISDEDIAV